MVLPVQQFNELSVVHLISAVGLTTAKSSSKQVCIMILETRYNYQLIA